MNGPTATEYLNLVLRPDVDTDGFEDNEEIYVEGDPESDPDREPVERE